MQRIGSSSSAASTDYEQDDFVSIDVMSDDEAQVRVTCPDKTGLDQTRTIFDFGLVVLKGDFATDGKWAFVLCTVKKQESLGGGPVNWDLLRVRMENLCPSKQSISTLSSLNLAAKADEDQADAIEPKPGTMYILQVEVEDRVGLLHDVTQELWASELTVHRAHISTSPAETAVDSLLRHRRTKRTPRRDAGRGGQSKRAETRGEAWWRHRARDAHPGTDVRVEDDQGSSFRAKLHWED